jgi:hypothetical protein
MERRLPHESEHLIAQLARWIDWRYARSKRLVLTSAPISLPPSLGGWRPAAVWRLAWQTDGSALLYGLAPSVGSDSYFVLRYDGAAPPAEGLFERLQDGTWRCNEGDPLMLAPLDLSEAA